jgi:hypothetical protein
LFISILLEKAVLSRYSVRVRKGKGREGELGIGFVLLIAFVLNFWMSDLLRWISEDWLDPFFLDFLVVDMDLWKTGMGLVRRE